MQTLIVEPNMLHPDDFYEALINIHRDLTRAHARFPMPAPLRLDELETFLRAARDRFRVRWTDVDVTGEARSA